ncbi:hypothetical protein CENSYa_1786 [Cenarchaeum symbiosum A]|uniref:Uncharacterized protein n=1 Tax=Cenarchaeum symbiosum (strain A) TaxID=414004 RepID=A0RYH9_CENSY|nr:hypothetical protein CENSYa_1786 [Cenarchaeum symbiosum A]
MRRACPKCGSKKIAEFMYGYPADMEDWLKKIDSGRYHPGGCCVTGHDPKWHCNACSLDFYKLGEVPPWAAEMDAPDGAESPGSR